MGETLDRRHDTAEPAGRVPDWRRKMSDNVAYALITYTGLQIFSTVHALKKGLPPVVTYIVLVILIAAIIPACRLFERRWLGIPDEAAHDHALAGAFRRDQAMLWLLAIGLPFLITWLCKLAFTGT